LNYERNLGIIAELNARPILKFVDSYKINVKKKRKVLLMPAYEFHPKLSVISKTGEGLLGYPQKMA
jgi:hypothetical protein